MDRFVYRGDDRSRIASVSVARPVKTQNFECVQPVRVFYICRLFPVDGDPILKLCFDGFGFLARSCELPFRFPYCLADDWTTHLR
jgi:hypothetical protein